MCEQKKWVKCVFDRAASEYGNKNTAFFNYFGKRLTEQVELKPHQQILDIGTGRGAVLFPLAQAVGPLGKVTGIDISPEMLSETSKEVQSKLISWIDLIEMDAEHLEFENNSFDFVFCGFALFFMPSVATALAEFRRVLKMEGKLVVSNWGDPSVLKSWMKEETKKWGYKHGLVATALWSATELYKALEEAHFIDILVKEDSILFTHESPEAWWESLWSHGTRAILEKLNAKQLHDLHLRAIQKAQSLDNGQGIQEELRAFYGIAKKKINLNY